MGTTHPLLTPRIRGLPVLASPTRAESLRPRMTQEKHRSDTISTFATDLRELRLKAGDPTLAALESRTGISKSVISDAFAGRRLPTEKTVGQLVDAIGGNRAQWLERRAALDPKSQLPARVTQLPESTAGTRRTVSLLTTVLVAAGSAAVTAVVTSFVWSSLPSTEAAESSTPAASYIDYADGVDPMQTICREDAVIAASEERLDGDVLVQMMYSKQCMAVWGRITRYDGNAAGNSVSMLIYPAVDLESPRNQERSAYDVQSLYTTLMIEPDVEARVCGFATITNGGDPVELGPPMCV